MGNIIDQGPVLLSLGLESSITDAEQAVVHASIRRAEAEIKKYLRYDPVKRSRTEYYPAADRSRSAREAVWETNATTAYLRRESGASTDELQLSCIPIRSDTDIRIYIDYDGRFGAKSGAFASDTEKTLGQDFWPNYDGVDDDGNEICKDGIVRSIGLWPIEPGSVKVIYTAGYTANEFNGSNNLVDATSIHEACVNEAVRRAKKVFVNKKSAIAGFVAGPMTSEKLGDYSYTLDASTANSLFGNTTGLQSESKDMLREFVNWGLDV